MKFRCDRDAFSEALQMVQRSVSSRPGIPALTGVLLEASESGNLTLKTTDLEMSAQIGFDVQVTEPGRALAPARLLVDIVKNLSVGQVEFESDERSQAQIRSNAYEGTLRLLPAEDFPALQEPQGTAVHVEAAAFAEAAGQVGRAASRDEARPILTGVLLEISREGVTLAATDSYRLAVRELTATADGEAKAVVPERALAEAARAAGADDVSEVSLHVDESQASFTIGSMRLTSRLIEGEFPNFRQLLPEGYENRMSMPRQKLIEAVQRVGLFAKDNTPVRMEFNPLGVRLSAQSQDGQSVEAIDDAAYEGEEITVAFNPGYLVEGLKAAAGETVRLEIRDGLKPGVVKGENDEFVYLVMPVRLPAPVG